MNETAPENKDQKTGPKLLGPVDIETVMAHPNVIKIYANGFTLGHSFVDATMIIQHGKMPIAAVSMPFAALKSLNRAIGETIAKIEAGLGQTLPDTKELSVTWNENLKKNK
jgi:hypothetical protein